MNVRIPNFELQQIFTPTLVTEMRQVAAIEHVVRAMIMERRRQITSAITESGRKSIHFKTTRKPDFVCIKLLSRGVTSCRDCSVHFAEIDNSTFCVVHHQNKEERQVTTLIFRLVNLHVLVFFESPIGWQAGFKFE